MARREGAVTGGTSQSTLPPALFLLPGWGVSFFFLQTPSTMILPNPHPPKSKGSCGHWWKHSAKISSSSLGSPGIYHSREAMTRKMGTQGDSMAREVSSPFQPSHSIHVLHPEPELRHGTVRGLPAPGIPEFEFQDWGGGSILKGNYSSLIRDTWHF